MSGKYVNSPLAKRLLETGTTAIKSPTNWARLLGLPLSALTGILSSTHLGAEDMPTGDAEQEYFDYYNQYGDNYGDLKIPGWRKKMMDKRATQKGIAQVAMQKQIQEAEATQQAVAAQAAAQQVRQNIQTYGNRDRPDTGMNRPGGGRGRSPTGGNVAGTPFARGGLIDLYRYGGFI